MIRSPSERHSAAVGARARYDWRALAGHVLEGHPLTEQEALGVLESSDDDLLDVMAAAFRVRRHFFGTRVQLYFLMNAKSGLCSEDCEYCSQSKIASSNIPKYNLLDRRAILDGARLAIERKAKTYCIVLSGRSPSEREMDAVTRIVPEIKAEHDLKICVCLGLLNDEQASQLKACGVDRVNHNVNTSPDYYGRICSTHSYQDRIDTLRAVRASGLEVCSGGIVGMGERPVDVARMAIELRDLGVESIPVNFLISIDGTPLESVDRLSPRDCLRVLAMFRLVNPDREIRIAGGREQKLKSLQPLGLYAANSIFVGDYLTTEGQPAAADYAMIEELGFQVDVA
ncbi:MAG: biotin synthase BioB [Pirellulales bacterium]